MHQAQAATASPLRPDAPVRLASADVDRIVSALLAASAHSPQVPRPEEQFPDTEALSPKEAFQHGIRQLQANNLRRAEQALAAADLPPRPPATDRAPAAWHISSTGTSRASAVLVETLHQSDSTGFAAACELREPATIRFTYRWVRAQFAVDDHGELSATPLAPSPAAHCLIDRLATAGVLGRRNHGKAAWTLEARLVPGQEDQP